MWFVTIGKGNAFFLFALLLARKISRLESVDRFSSGAVRDGNVRKKSHK